jgi:hypothetical protein
MSRRRGMGIVDLLFLTVTSIGELEGW